MSGFPPERVIGCVVYPAAELLAPGVVKHIEGDRFPVGELDGACSERVQRVSQCLTRAGFKSPVLEDIRAEIWLKLWGNLTFNPISALTRSTLVDICQFPPTRELAAAMMARGADRRRRSSASCSGVGLEKRIAGAEKVGQPQDLDAAGRRGRPARRSSTRWWARWSELGRLTDTPTPHIDAVYGLTHLLARTIAASAIPRCAASE